MFVKYLYISYVSPSWQQRNLGKHLQLIPINVSSDCFSTILEILEIQKHLVIADSVKSFIAIGGNSYIDVSV